MAMFQGGFKLGPQSVSQAVWNVQGATLKPESSKSFDGGYRFIGNAKRTSLYDVINLFGDIAGDAGEIKGAAGNTAIGQALASVLREIDEIAVATFKSISLATLLKLMERRERNAVAAE